MLKTILTRIFLFLLLCTAPETREKPNWREQKGLPSSHTFFLKLPKQLLASKCTRT